MTISKHVSAFFLCCYLVLASADTLAQAKGNNVTQGTYRTIFEMLRDVPGLEVRTTNDKNGGTVIVRGTGSLNNQKPPLIVVDGSIYNGNITNINTQDVDGISVLKDAASAAAYGAQGAGGVILITTKNGTVVSKAAVVSNYTKSAYTYFIEHKTPLKIIGFAEEVLAEGIIQKEIDSSLVFIKRKKELLIPIKNIKRVEMIRE